MEFEIRSKDGLARVADLRVNDKEVTTPALMPVLNPHLGIPDLTESEIVITNAYILAGSDDYRDSAMNDGVHDALDFDGVVVTDSGAYQQSVYGDETVEMTNREVLEFQREIGVDIATPLDVPTPPDASREEATRDLELTHERIQEARDFDMHINAPVQGSLYTDLRKEAAWDLYGNYSVYPVGGVVPLLQEYRFQELVDVVVAVKKGLGMDAPVHLFGAGHPMMFALGAALGCDLFDSAAYALYARKNRYLTPQGTLELDEVHELPCGCSVCMDCGADELDEELLAQHNLNVSFAELRRVREAVRGGGLFEYLDMRCRAHPALLDGLKQLGEYVGYVEEYDPVVKSTFFYLGNASRPEVVRHHERLDRFSVGEEAVISVEDTGDVDFLVNPPFGPFPVELRETYPVNAETPMGPDAEAVESTLRGIKRLVRLNPGTSFVFRHPEWSHTLLDELRELGVEVELNSD